MANSHHVPKFGNWDRDNVAYTAYFENGQRKTIGGMINPNDPATKNAEALNNTCSHNDVVDVAAGGEVKGSSSPAAHHSHNTMRHHHVHHRNRGSQSQSQSRSFTTTTTNTATAESGSERSHSDHKRGIMSKAGSSVITSSFSSSSHHRYRSSGISHSFNDPHMIQEGTAIPKFGTWDVSDPKSGEGYTAIFTKIKEEKQIASAGSSTPPLNNCSHIKNHVCEGHSSILSKYCCCLFSSQSK